MRLSSPGFRVVALVILVIECAALPRTNNTTGNAPNSNPIPDDKINHWVGTWATAMEGADTSRSFVDQTVREIVHTSVGGSRVRIHLSNVFGTSPVFIEDVHIALRKSGTAILTASDRILRFNGRPFARIKQGSEAISDPVDFEVPALTDVAVSFFMRSTTGPATWHHYGHQTSYVGQGDTSATEDLVGAETTTSYYFLSNLDVQGVGLNDAIVTLGASITEGFSATDDTNRRWPDDLAKRLVHAGMKVGVLNQGISGNRLLVGGNGPSAIHRFQRDVLNQSGVRWVIFSDDPINDLGMTRPAPDATVLMAGIQQLIRAAHRKNVRFLCATLTPFEGAGYWTQHEESIREQINAFVRSKESHCDGLIEMDPAVHNPENPTWFLPSYDSGDHLHPNDVGEEAIGDSVSLEYFGAGNESEQ